MIKAQSSKLKTQNQNSKFKTIYVEAGVKLNDLVRVSLEESLTGLEWIAGIPGTVGGAIRGNAGAFEKSMADVIKKVEVLEINSELIIKNYKLKNCKFDYRSSIFKENKNLVVLSAEIQLEIADKTKIRENIERYLNYRKNKHPLDFPSAGSILKIQKITPLGS